MVRTPKQKKIKKKKGIVSFEKKDDSKTPVRMEWARQLMHLLVGLGCVAVLASTSLEIFRNFVLGLLLIGMILSLLARTNKIGVLTRVLSIVERPHEGVPGQGVFLFLVGVGIPAFLFSDAFAVLVGIVALTFQDAFSTLVGMRFGRTPVLARKSLEGFAGGLAACTIGLSALLPFPFAFGISVVVSLVELLPLDDAITLPLVASYLAGILI